MTKPGISAVALLALAMTAGCKAGPTSRARERGQPIAAEPDPPATQRMAAPAATPRAVAPRAVAPAPTAQAKAAGERGWNAAQIDWIEYDKGIARARAQHKPACLVLFATWCPHCKNYSHVFEDPRVVAESKKFVMIRVDTDRQPEVSSRYSLDGAYVPRTYFLSPDGKVAEAVHPPRARFQYFYNEHDPASLLGGMRQAEKLAD